MIKHIYILITAIIITGCNLDNKGTSAEKLVNTKKNISIPDTVILAALDTDGLVRLGKTLANNVEASDSGLDTLSIKYNCPDILDKGYLKGYYKNGILVAFNHVYQNGKFIQSHDDYYLFEDQLVQVDTRESKAEFGVGESESTMITTYQQFLLKNQSPVVCKRKKFTHKPGENVAAGKDLAFKPFDCDANKSIHQKYLMLRSTLLRKDFVAGSCYF
jgi:hypothetical protein